MDYGLNLNRLDIPVNPYEVFKCDVPNIGTLLLCGEMIHSIKRTYPNQTFLKELCSAA